MDWARIKFLIKYNLEPLITIGVLLGVLIGLLYIIKFLIGLLIFISI